MNGGVGVTGVAAPVELTTVNGKITLAGARRDAKLNTVNGAIDAVFTDLPKGSNLDVRTVNGSIALTLPAKAGFRLEGHTMSGEILSSFGFPVTPTPEAAPRQRRSARRAREDPRRPAEDPRRDPQEGEGKAKAKEKAARRTATRTS